MTDAFPPTTGSPYHHEDERECFRLRDGSGWAVWRRETGIAGHPGERCDRTNHPGDEPDPAALSRRFECSSCGATMLTRADTLAVRCPACGKPTMVEQSSQTDQTDQTEGATPS